MTTVALTLLAAAAVLLMIRVFIGPSVADRIVGLDGVLIVVVGILAVDGVRSERVAFVDVALVISLLAFVGTGIAARFIEQRGA